MTTTTTVTTKGGRPTATFSRMVAEVMRICSAEQRWCALREIVAEVRTANDARQAEIDQVRADAKAAAARGDLRAAIAARRDLQRRDAAAARERALIRRLSADSQAAYRKAVVDHL